MAEYILGNSLRGAARKYPLIQRILWRVDYAIIWTLIKSFGLLPPDTASAFGDFFGRIIGMRLRRKTEIFRENLAIAFPQKNAAELQQLLRSSWGRAGRLLAEYPHFKNIYESRDRERLHIEMLDPSANYGPDSPPLVVVSAHHSNWEMVASSMSRLGIPNVSLYTPLSNRLLDRMMSESREKLNCHLIPRDNSARTLMRAIKKGKSAGLVMDRRVDEGKPVRFFGRDKLSTLLPAKLALKFDIDMVPVRVKRLRGAEFQLIYYPPIKPANPSADENAQALDMITQLHQLFEQWIREDPQDWFCPKRMWPKIESNANDSSSDSSSNKSTEEKSYAA